MTTVLIETHQSVTEVRQFLQDADVAPDMPPETLVNAGSGPDTTVFAVDDSDYETLLADTMLDPV